MKAFLIIQKLFLPCVVIMCSASTVVKMHCQTITQCNTKQRQLFDVCKIWGTVKFLHPHFVHLSTKLWDSALVKALPNIGSANNQREYAFALNSMLSALNDPYSLVEYNSVLSQKQTDVRYKIATDIRDSIIYVRLPLSFSSHITSQQKAQALGTFFLQRQDSIKGFILDLRGDSTIKYPALTIREQLSFNHNILSKALGYYIAKDILLPRSRMRIYHRYCPESIYDFTDVMRERFEQCPKEMLHTEGRIIRKKTQIASFTPMIILANCYTFGVDDIISALQEQCSVIVIQHGKKIIPNSGNVISITLSDSIVGCLRTSEHLYYGRETLLRPDIIMNEFTSPTTTDTCVKFAYTLLQKKNTPAPNSVTTMKEKVTDMEDSYKSMLFPSREYRFLAFFRFWNVIQYFFPYKNHMDISWEQTFFDCIPKIENARDSLEYAMVIREVVSRLNDSHAQVQFQVFANTFGIANERRERDYLPLLLQYIEQQTVITGILDEKIKQNGINIGDIITHINSRPIKEVITHYLRDFSHSTLQAGIERIHSHYLLIGKRSDSTHITVKTANNVNKNIIIPHTISALQPSESYNLPSIKLLTKEIGYADLRRIPLAHCDSLFTVFRDTKGIIFDLRGYPNNGVGWEIASRLTDKRVLAAKFAEPIINPSRYFSLKDTEQQSLNIFDQFIEPSNDKLHYKGKVIVLIDAKAMSQAEHICLLLEAASNTVFVGSPTNGTDGTVTSTILPGGIEVQFSGQEVRHADGRQLQRIGIIPDVEVKPTIAGIRAGRDEVLEKGIEVLQSLLAKKK